MTEKKKLVTLIIGNMKFDLPGCVKMKKDILTQTYGNKDVLGSKHKGNKKGLPQLSNKGVDSVFGQIVAALVKHDYINKTEAKEMLKK